MPDVACSIKETKDGCVPVLGVPKDEWPRKRQRINPITTRPTVRAKNW